MQKRQEPKDSKHTKAKRTAATTGRLNLDLGIRRKAGFEYACAYRELKLVEAVKQWMDRFIAITPGVPPDLMPAPLDNDPHTVLPSLTGGPTPIPAAKATARRHTRDPKPPAKPAATRKPARRDGRDGGQGRGRE